MRPLVQLQLGTTRVPDRAALVRHTGKLDVHVIADNWDRALYVLQVVSVLATVAAVWFAAITIRQAKKQAQAAQVAQVRERQIDWELDLLKELFLASERLDLTVLRLARMLPMPVIPLTRAALRMGSTPEAERRV